MSLGQANVFLWLMGTLLSASQVASNTYGAYTTIETDVEYVPWSSGLSIGDINNVNLLTWCAMLCMRNTRCLTANYYSSIEKCTLFNAGYSQGARRPTISVQIINMVDRVQCNVTFANHTTYPTGHNPQSVAVADVNGDNKIDVVVANFAENTTSILFNAGDGTFINRTTYSTGASPIFLVAADINGDNQTDIIVANHNAKNIGVLLNIGNGLFINQTTYSVGANPWSLAVTDVNGDSAPDIIVLNEGESNVGVLFYKGNGTFTNQTIYPTGSGPISVAVTDVNGDNKPDIIVVNQSANNVSVLFNIGNGTFASQMTYPTGSNPHYMAAVDINGDNKTDIIVANYADSNIGVLLNRGNGTFARYIPYSTGTTVGPYAVAVFDVNGDNKPDLISANYQANTVSILLNEGNGTFANQTTYSTGLGSTPQTVALADFNGDGKTDIVVSNSNGNTVGVFLASC